MKHITNITLLTFSLFIWACQNKTSTTEASSSDLIEITKIQFKSGEMEMAVPERKDFADKIHFTGTIEPSPNGRAIVSAPIAGTIKSIHAVTGQSVQKGTTLLTVSGHAIIDLQKDYAESAANLQRLQMDYERIKVLYNENVGSKKDFTLAENSYKVELAKSNALKMKLESAGLNAEKIADGVFSDAYSLKAPIAGYVSQIDASVGQFVEPLSVLSEIVDASSFRLAIPVFGSDINKLSTGKAVVFYAGNNQENSHATLNNIGKSIDPITKAVVCYAQIKEFNNLVSYQFVEGNIILSSDTSYAVPTSAILKSDKDYFVLVLKKETEEAYFFEKTKITIGRESTKYTEMKGHELEEEKVLFNGVYHIEVE